MRKCCFIFFTLVSFISCTSILYNTNYKINTEYKQIANEKFIEGILYLPKENENSMNDLNFFIIKHKNLKFFSDSIFIPVEKISFSLNLSLINQYHEIGSLQAIVIKNGYKSNLKYNSCLSIGDSSFDSPLLVVPIKLKFKSWKLTKEKPNFYGGYCIDLSLENPEWYPLKYYYNDFIIEKYEIMTKE